MVLGPISEFLEDGGTFLGPVIAPSFNHAAVNTTTNYYVNGTTGSNSNNGTAAGTPWLTIQHALDYIGASSYQGAVQINIAAGTYVENLTFYPFQGSAVDSQTGNPCTIILSGDETTPTNVKIKPASGTVITAGCFGLGIKLLGLNITSSSAASTGISISYSQIYLRNTQIDSVKAFVSANSGAIVEWGSSTAGTTWTASATAGTLISLLNYAIFQHDGGTCTLVAGAATVTMVTLSGYSKMTTAGIFTLAGTPGVTAYGIRATAGSTFAPAGTSLTITGITGAPTANLWSAMAVGAIEGSLITLFSTTTYTFTTCTNAWFLQQNSNILANGSLTTTYTTVTQQIILDHTCNVDATDLVDITSGQWLWNATRSPGNPAAMSDAFRAGTATAAANNLVLPSDGNIVHITGATQINLIANTPLFYPRYILIFDSTPVIKDNQTASGANKPILLQGSTDRTAAANSTSTIVYDATNSVWIETAKSAR